MPTPLTQFLKQKVYRENDLIAHSTSTEKSIYAGTDYFERIWRRLKKKKKMRWRESTFLRKRVVY